MTGSRPRLTPDQMRRQVEGRTVAKMFLHAVRTHADLPALRAGSGADRITWTYAEYGRIVARVAGRLRSLGVGPGDRVSLLVRNRPEFHALDMATLMLGATPTSLYFSSAPEQIRSLVERAGSRVVVVDGPEPLDRLRAARAYGNLPPHVVMLDDPEGAAPAGVLRWADLVDGDPVDLDAAAASVRPDGIATIIFTSGTTGPPKGAQLSHAGLCALVESYSDALGPDFRAKRLISYMPMAHIAERATTLYLPLRDGHDVTSVPEVTALTAYLPQVRPQYLFGPPRIWEKLWAGTQHVRAAAEVEPTAAQLLAAVALDATEVAMTAAAAMPPAVIEGFRSLGLPLVDGYGMTECGTATMEISDPRPGTVGRALSGTQVRIAADGEIELDSAAAFVRYLDDPERTAETFTADGWLRTGDLGSLDADGFLTLTGRKKDLIITAGGKNIAPTPIESHLVRHPLVANAVVIGESRRYLTALLVLDPMNATGWAEQRGLPADAATLATAPEVQAELRSLVDEVNAVLSRVEQIKRFAVVPQYWAPDSEELTPTMKVRRAVVVGKYADLVESLYG